MSQCDVCVRHRLEGNDQQAKSLYFIDFGEEPTSYMMYISGIYFVYI